MATQGQDPDADMTTKRENWAQPASPADTQDVSRIQSRRLSGVPTRHSTASARPSRLESTKLDKTDSIARAMPFQQEVLFVFTIAMAQAMTQAGFGQVLATMHIIGDSFHVTDPGALAWLVAGYSLTVGTFILVGGRLGDLFGYKRMFIVGFLWMSLWSLVAGFSVYSNSVLFTFCRALQGGGPALLLPNGLAILGATYPPGKRKNMAFAIFGGCAPTGAILGMIFASIFAQLLWWPWAFWAQSIACLVFAALGAYAIISPQSPSDLKGSMAEKMRKMDFPGAFTGITALVLINVAWNQAPTVGWDKEYVWFLLIIGFILLAGFFLIEIKVSKNPLIPFDALSAEVSFVLGCLALGWSCFGIWIFYFLQFLSQLRHESPLLQSAHLAPVAAVGMCAGITTGFLMSRVRPAYILAIALMCFAMGSILIGTAPVQQFYWTQTFFSLLVAPFGMDMSFPAATVMLSNSVKKEHQGIAASLVMTVVNYSISLGLGFAGTVEVHVNHGGGTPELLLQGYRGAWYMGIGLASGGVVLSMIFALKQYLRDRTARAPGSDSENASTEIQHEKKTESDGALRMNGEEVDEQQRTTDHSDSDQSAFQSRDKEIV